MAENETEEVFEETEEGGSRRGGILPLLAVLLLTLGGGGVAGAKVLGPKVGPVLAERSLEAPKKKKKGGHGAGEESTLHVVDNLVLNPASSGGSRFLLTSIALETESVEDVAELAARDVEIRDAFIRVLGTKTVDELTDMTQRTQIISELMDSVETLVGPGMVHRIFIPQFVIQ